MTTFPEQKKSTIYFLKSKTEFQMRAASEIIDHVLPFPSPFFSEHSVYIHTAVSAHQQGLNKGFLLLLLDINRVEKHYLCPSQTPAHTLPLTGKFLSKLMCLSTPLYPWPYLLCILTPSSIFTYHFPPFLLSLALIPWVPFSLPKNILKWFQAFNYIKQNKKSNFFLLAR